MSFDLLTRTLAVSILASSLVVIVVLATRYAPSSARVSNDTGDPRAIEHKRCKELGLDAAIDEACRALWTKDHDQFFGLSRPHQPRPGTPSSAVFDHKHDPTLVVPNSPGLPNDRPLEPSAGK